MTLAERITELIEQHGSLRAAARVLDCDAGYLSRLQSGEKDSPEDWLLRRMKLRRVVSYERADTSPPVLQKSEAELSGETVSQREEVCAAWNDLPAALRCHPGLKRLYRALGGVRMDMPSEAEAAGTADVQRHIIVCLAESALQKQPEPVQPVLAGVEPVSDADNQWFGDMMILQVLADSENVNEQEREVLTRWMAASDRPSVLHQQEVPSGPTLEDAYAEGRRDEQEELASVLPCVTYMDPPDGGAPTVLEQLQRQAKDAARYLWLRNTKAYVAVHPHHKDLPKDQRTGWTIRMVSGNDESFAAAVDAAMEAEGYSPSPTRQQEEKRTDGVKGLGDGR
jgi:hypothetical protein